MLRRPPAKKATCGATFVRVSAAPVGAATPTNPTAVPTTTAIQLHPGVPGSASMAGCDDGLWRHVYHPTRLLVKNDCVIITGTIIDNTSGRKADSVRHEAEVIRTAGCRLIPQFASLINPGKTSDEGGNLVFEIVCH